MHIHLIMMTHDEMRKYLYDRAKTLPLRARILMEAVLDESTPNAIERMYNETIELESEA